MKRIYPKTRTSKLCSLFLTSNYYLVFINPNIHKKDWNALRLIMKVTEINYLLFINTNIKTIEIYPIDKQEYNDYYYNPN